MRATERKNARLEIGQTLTLGIPQGEDQKENDERREREKENLLKLAMTETMCCVANVLWHVCERAKEKDSRRVRSISMEKSERVGLFYLNMGI